MRDENNLVRRDLITVMGSMLFLRTELNHYLDEKHPFMKVDDYVNVVAILENISSALKTCLRDVETFQTKIEDERKAREVLNK